MAADIEIIKVKIDAELKKQADDMRIPFEIKAMDVFYNPHNMKRLERSIASFNAGKGTI